MRWLVLVLVLVLVLCQASEQNDSEKAPLKEHPIPEPYHLTAEILRLVSELSHSCNSNAWSLENRVALPLSEFSDLLLHQKGPGLADVFFDRQSELESSLLALEESVELIRDPAHVKNMFSGENKRSLPRTRQSVTSLMHQHNQVLQVDDDSSLEKEDPKEPEQATSLPAEGLPVIKISVQSQDSAPKHHALIMFGEHGREFISSEIAISFLREIHKVACTPTHRAPQSEEQVKMRSILSQWDLTILPLVSPSARQIAEKHNFCNRKNAHGVDVNRNYPFHFGEGESDKSEEFPGSSPLSEPETRIATQLAREVRPNLFLSIHSGSELIVTSPAYRKMDLEKMPTDVQSVVNTIHQQHCPECGAGPASQVLSYLAYGCSMDFMFEQEFETQPHNKQNRFSFTFETWAGDREKEHLKNLNLEQMFGERASAIRAQNEQFYKYKDTLSSREFGCLQRFNPPPAMFEAVVDRWTRSLFATLHAVGNKLSDADN